MTPDHEPLVTDRRQWPKGLVSSKLKIVLAAALTLLVVIAITLSGNPPDTLQTVVDPSLAGLNLTPTQVQGLQERLEAGIDRARAQAEAVPLPTPVADPQPRPSGGRGVAAPASLEREAQDRESLRASNLVFSRRADATNHRQVPSSRAAGDEEQAFQPPALDDVTKSVVAALQAASGASTGAPQAPPVQAPIPPAQVSPAPTGWHLVYEGTVIDATLANRLDGSMEGPVNALVSVPVFAKDRVLVIPAGARVLGLARAIQSLDDSRLAVAFHRIVMPNGQDVDLNQFVGMNVRGDVGLSGDVNRHYLSTFGAAAAVGLISGLAQWAGSGFGSASDRTVIVSGVGDSASQATSQTMSRFLNRRPTITIPEGSRLKVYITSDLSLPAYGSAQ